MVLAGIARPAIRDRPAVAIPITAPEVSITAAPEDEGYILRSSRIYWSRRPPRHVRQLPLTALIIPSVALTPEFSDRPMARARYPGRSAAELRVAASPPDSASLRTAISVPASAPAKVA